MNKICDKKFKIIYGNRRHGDAVRIVSDVTELKKTIKWTPKYNDLSLILKSTMEWEQKLENEKIL